MESKKPDFGNVTPYLVKKYLKKLTLNMEKLKPDLGKLTPDYEKGNTLFGKKSKT